jgi:hypothetical protein
MTISVSTYRMLVMDDEKEKILNSQWTKTNLAKAGDN